MLTAGQALRAIDDAAHDDIRGMLATIEAAGWTSITQTVLEP